MTWEEMYNNALEVVQLLKKEIKVLQSIVRLQLPIIEKDDEDLPSL